MPSRFFTPRCLVSFRQKTSVFGAECYALAWGEKTYFNLLRGGNSSASRRPERSEVTQGLHESLRRLHNFCVLCSRRGRRFLPRRPRLDLHLYLFRLLTPPPAASPSTAGGALEGWRRCGGGKQSNACAASADSIVAAVKEPPVFLAASVKSCQ